MHQIDAGHELEQLAGDMLRAADAGRCHVDLARIGFGIGDEFRNRFAGNDGLTSMTSGTRSMPAIGAISRTKSNGRCRNERLVDGVLRIDQKQRVAVGRGIARPPRWRYFRSAPGRIFDDELLIEMFAKATAPISRALMSDELPAAWPTITCTGRVG